MYGKWFKIPIWQVVSNVCQLQPQQLSVNSSNRKFKILVLLPCLWKYSDKTAFFTIYNDSNILTILNIHKYLKIHLNISWNLSLGDSYLQLPRTCNCWLVDTYVLRLNICPLWVLRHLCLHIGIESKSAQRYYYFDNRFNVVIVFQRF